MGMGLYLIFPAFFTDTTDAYRLNRWARVRTDLGGFYFHAIFALVLIGTYLLTRQDFLLLPVLLIDLDIVYQCLPFVRLDGYWALADMTGIPDFFSLMAPFIASIAPARASARPQLPALRPVARRVFLLYTVLVVPVLIGITLLAVTRIPWLVSTTWNLETVEQQQLTQAVGTGDPLLAGVVVLQMLLSLLPAIGTAYLLFSFGTPVVGFAYQRIARRADA
jgi:putative peptide zinc metalloprotease protein